MRAGHDRQTHAAAASRGRQPRKVDVQAFTDAPRKDDSTWSLSGGTKADWVRPSGLFTDVPEWKVDYTGVLAGPRSLQFSAGVFGREGDPLPAYLSDGFSTPGPLGAAALTAGPGARVMQWHAKFGVQAPLWTSPRVKVRAFSEAYVPIHSAASPRPGDVTSPILQSRALRVGIAILF